LRAKKEEFDYDVKRNGEVAWIAGEEGSITTVRNTYNKNNILFTRFSYENTGALFDINPMKKGKGQLPLKMSDVHMQNIDRYGGYNNVYSAYFCLVEHTYKKNRISTIEYVPVYLSKAIKRDKRVLFDYLENTLKLEDIRVLVPKIKLDTLFCINGFYMHISGRTGDRIIFKNAMQLTLDNDMYAYMKMIHKYEEFKMNNKSEIGPDVYNVEITKEKNVKLFGILVSKMIATFAHGYGSSGKKMDANKFDTLSLKEQCAMLKHIVSALKCNAVCEDLSIAGGNKTTGKILVNKKITDLEQISIINQSPTGLFREIVDLKKL